MIKKSHIKFEHMLTRQMLLEDAKQNNPIFGQLSTIMFFGFCVPFSYNYVNFCKSRQTGCQMKAAPEVLYIIDFNPLTSSIHF